MFLLGFILGELEPFLLHPFWKQKKQKLIGVYHKCLLLGKRLKRETPHKVTPHKVRVMPLEDVTIHSNNVNTDLHFMVLVSLLFLFR